MEQVEALPIPTAALAPASRSSLRSWVTTVDHKKVGILYFWTSFFFFLLGGVEAIAVRTQLIVPDAQVLTAQVYNQMFTMHAFTMVFLALMPLTASFFNYMIPLQIGARDVAFPRLNALSYWIYLFAGIFINLGFVYPLFGLPLSLPNAGWFAYANITERAFSPGSNIDFYVLGLQILGISSIISSINFIVTILNMRAPGMRLMRMPIFTWMALITAVLLATAMSVLTIALAQLMFDRFFGTTFYDIAKGGDPLIWQHLFWMFGHPEVYILILPIFGMVSEVLPTFSRKPLFGYNLMVFSGILIGWLSWGVWSHHMFATGLGAIADSFFAINSMLIAIPTGIKIFNWLATLWGGNLRFTTAMMFATGFLVTFTIGGLSGVMHAAAPADLQQTDTYFVVAHIHYVFFGGTVMGLWAGIYYWYPKMFGRLLNEKLGWIHFWGTFVAMNLTFFPMHFLGLHGMPRRVFTYAAELGFNEMNLLASLGSYLLGAATLVFAYNLLTARKHGEPAGANPWAAPTLEWSVPSPPPEYNFARVPVVQSRMPLWERDRPLDLAATRTVDADSSIVHTAHSLGIHLPPSSTWPIALAFAITAFFAGWMVHWAVSAMALLMVTFCVYAFAFEPGHGGIERPTR